MEKVRSVHDVSTNIMIYIVIQKRSIFWEVIVPVIVRKKVLMNMCLILNGCRDTTVCIYKDKIIVNGNK